jgi:hypothetical protein
VASFALVIQPLASLDGFPSTESKQPGWSFMKPELRCTPPRLHSAKPATVAEPGYENRGEGL